MFLKIYHFIYLFWNCLTAEFSRFRAKHASGTRGARFNGPGTQLLCLGTDSILTIYDLPTLRHSSDAGKVTLKNVDFANENSGCDAFCFAGLDDELVIAGSDDSNLHVWSQADGKGQDLTDNQSFHALSGHKKSIRCVRSSPDQSSIVSCGDGAIIKFWIPSAS